MALFPSLPTDIRGMCGWVEMFQKCLSGMHSDLAVEYVSFSKGFHWELGNYSLF